MCHRRFTPALRDFYRRFEHSPNPIEVVFVSSDSTAHDAGKHFAGAHGSWLSLAWGDPLAAALKRRHRVWSGREVGTFGASRRAGVPSVVVINPQGEELAFLAGERYGAAALMEWEPAKTMEWPDEL